MTSVQITRSKWPPGSEASEAWMVACTPFARSAAAASSNGQRVRIETVQIVVPAAGSPVQRAEQRPVSAPVVEDAVAVSQGRPVDDTPVAFGSERVMCDQPAPDLAPVVRAGLRVLGEPGVGEFARAHAAQLAFSNMAHQRRSNSPGVQSLPGSTDTARLLALAAARSAGWARKYLKPSSRPARSADAHT